MIKSLIILILAGALAAGSFLSRPAPADFKTFVKDKLQHGTGTVDKFFADARADSYVKSCTIKDNFLWITVEKDGKRVYTGAFNHWWGPDQPPK